MNTLYSCSRLAGRPIRNRAQLLAPPSSHCHGQAGVSTVHLRSFTDRPRISSLSRTNGASGRSLALSALDASSNSTTTIYALSTPPGKSAVAVIRISGPLCMNIYRTLCPTSPAPQPRKAALRTLYQPNNSAVERDSADAVLDPGALVLYFPGPHSFTGEDILELHVHGGPALLKSVLVAIPRCQPAAVGLESAGSASVLPAEPGEFTRRAFYNSKLSLPQIEALGETLSAETEQQRLLSVRASATGHSRLTAKYESWRSQLVSARAELEALIDFSEDQQFEETPSQLLDGVVGKVLALLREMRLHIEDAVKGELMRGGIRMVLLGAPNAGKSSLLNKIVGRDAVIVSSTPGTTRDVIEVAIDVNGWLVLLGDTAGLRTLDITAGASPVFSCDDALSNHDIEMEGMRRAEERASRSDVAIFLVALKQDGLGFKLDVEEPAVRFANKLLADGKQVFVAINKVDLLPQPYHTISKLLVEEVRGLLPLLPEKRIFGISCTSSLPALEGTIQVLLKGLTDAFSEMTAATGDESARSEAIATTARQKALIEECINWLEEFLSGRDGCDLDGFSIDVVLKAEELRHAAHCLAKITGRGQEAGDVEEVLGVIFQKFCVGK